MFVGMAMCLPLSFADALYEKVPRSACDQESMWDIITTIISMYFESHLHMLLTENASKFVPRQD